MYINHHLGFILLFDLDLDICQSLICENCLEVNMAHKPFNPIKAGGLNLCIAWGKALENSYRVEMHVSSPVFQGQLIKKKLDR